MKARAAIAQCIWAAGNLAAARRFGAALRNPGETQRRWLMGRLRADAASAFGREHGFESIGEYRDFARKVPLRTWDDFSPWVERIRGGEMNVLGCEPVTHLAPTSGSSGARKLIPFTATLHVAFAEAVGAWMTDLARIQPEILFGPAYWSISPLAKDDDNEHPAARVGFADDADYLGGWRSVLARWLMAVPSELRHEANVDVFWLKTAECLLGERNLRLISVWHPSFLDLIVSAAQRNWERILPRLGPSRAAELERIGPGHPECWWPGLRVISCWGEQAAAPGFASLARRFPGCLVQAKGLLATEAVVTIPWRQMYPLAVCSHFFEFIDESGDIHLAQQLVRGKVYEVVVTNGGGLWRYRLGDLVECTGHCAATPTLRFLGRAGNVSDLCGEKLSEAFVAEVFDALWPMAEGRPKVAYLRPFCELGAQGYELVVTDDVADDVTVRLDHVLRANPHYDLARRLGQLDAPALCVDPDADLTGMHHGNQRLGDIKPVVLVTKPRRFMDG